ncbi:restriction endonuclease subunit M [Helicobacter cholecystus]|uniref:site-specific DNA-methyltransferase (adenine-specific) n=1 Tax=Helicobacter cholecystus TaxID=45498 RepID=A0A3D8IYE6_9HELI|nr:N-6 DNA methylase [Helicobacter cholecystus]RDU69935.1 restriction endonuclease subunit M [Helicobacter cholecystus]VEJ24901.1 type I restriction enzyme modification subunit [Helicobacter cholecystus]
MKKLLDCFDYIKRYHVDILESLYILLEFFILKKQDQISPLLQRALKRKKIYEECIELMQGSVRHFIAPNPNLNLTKILKILDQIPLNSQILGIFFDVVTQKKTQNKLYFYAMPLEVQILILSLLKIQKNESLYHPCYGLGSLFLQVGEGVRVYGEELDERFSEIAKLVCDLIDLPNSYLLTNDILKHSSFKSSKGFEKFDAMICNPPLHSHMGTHYIKEDERFTGVLSKSYPELIFLSHALVHFGGRGAFVLRSQIFKTSTLESKLHSFFEGRLQCIIQLPKNIFPYQNHDFSLVILKEGAKEILYINAEEFYRKEGRYNRLSNLEEILCLYKKNTNSKYSKKAKCMDEFFSHRTLAQESQSIGDIAQLIRGQRVYGSSKDEEIEYFEVGVSDFAPLGFSSHFENLRQKGNKEKIQKYALKPYDILIALRGNSPKIAILSNHLSLPCIANVGVLVLRTHSQEEALGLYGYLFSLEGERVLQELCDGVLDVVKLTQIPLPKDLNRYVSYMQEIESLAHKLEGVHQEILELREKICK